MTTTELAKKENQLPINFAEIQGLANAFVTSGMFQDAKQLSQAIVKIQAGKELGLPPVYSMQNINLIRGRLCSSANTLALLVKSSGKYDYRVIEHTEQICKIKFFQLYADKLMDVGESTFTIEDAKRADLLNPDSGWMKYPRAMLFSRAISQGARIYCPDAIGGIYTDEEVRAIPPKPEDAEIATVNVESGEIVEQKPIEQPALDQPKPKTLPALKDGPALVAFAQREKQMSLESIYRNLGITNPNDIKDVPAAAKVLGII